MSGVDKVILLNEDKPQRDLLDSFGLITEVRPISTDDINSVVSSVTTLISDVKSNDEGVIVLLLPSDPMITVGTYIAASMEKVKVFMASDFEGKYHEIGNEITYDEVENLTDKRNKEILTLKNMKEKLKYGLKQKDKENVELKEKIKKQESSIEERTKEIAILATDLTKKIRLIEDLESKSELEFNIKKICCPVTPHECPKPEVKPENKYFVAHAFSEGKIDDLRKAINEALQETELKPYYTDEEVKKGHILCKICERIRATKFGIYELSDQNPNVTPELGLAYGFGKPALLIVRKGSKIISDLHGLDRIEYGSYTQLTEELKNKIKKFIS